MTTFTPSTISSQSNVERLRVTEPTLRVMLVISNLEFGGAQRQAIELANHLDPARVDVHICSLSPFVPLGEAFNRRNDRLHIVTKRFKFDLTVVPRLTRLLKRHRIDVVHGYLFDADVASRLAGRLAGTPLVVGSERNTDYRIKPQQRLAYRATRNWVDLIVANSQTGAKFHARELGYDPSRYRVIHNGVDAVRFQPGNRAAIRRELGLSDTDLVVGTFASLKAQKNHPMVLAAARLLIGRLPDLKLLLVGDELYADMHGSHEYKERIVRQIDELGLRPYTISLGNRTDVERLYPACDVTVLPSLFEGTPNVALESMACAVPVVLTDVSDNKLIVPDGTAGYVVPLNDVAVLSDRLYALLTNEPLRQRLGRQAREWVERQFTTTRLADLTEDVYREALRTRRIRVPG